MSLRQAAKQAAEGLAFMTVFLAILSAFVFGIAYLGSLALGDTGILIGAFTGLALFAFCALTLAIWKGVT